LPSANPERISTPPHRPPPRCPARPKRPAPEALEPAPPTGGGKAQPAHTVARLEPRKEKPVAHAPTSRMTNREIGEKAETGDPYLNEVWALIERNREPTTPIGPSGLHLAGISILAVVIDRGGAMESLNLARSSGSALLDQEAQRMVMHAAPFPPLPSSYPAPARILVTINLFPR
jgi:protein TonB